MKPLTIVLGAGASKPFGLPIGKELKTAIESNQEILLTTGSPDYRFEHDRLRGQLNEFATESRGSGWDSIDRFLEFRHDYEQLGKEQIAWQLINRCNDALTERRMCSDWLSWLFNNLHSQRTSICDAPIQFVTFNYDCLLEIGLATMLANTQGTSLKQGLEEVSKLRIVHVYGKLEPRFTLMDVSDKMKLDDSIHAIKQLARGIKIMSQERDTEESAELKDAQQIIADATRVVFLGFGFDDMNLRRIGAHADVDTWQSRRPSVWGTCVEMTKLEMDEARSKLGVDPQLEACNCLDLFRRVKIV